MVRYNEAQQERRLQEWGEVLGRIGSTACGTQSDAVVPRIDLDTVSGVSVCIRELLAMGMLCVLSAQRIDGGGLLER